MKIEVTQEDISKAISSISDLNPCKYCIIFQALKRNGIPVKSVGMFRVTIGDKLETYKLPENAIKVTVLIPKEWKDVKPFSFEIDYKS